MIDQRFIDLKAQELIEEPEPQPDMQLASANTGVTTDGGAFVGYRMNMPKGLNTRENQAKQSVLIADTMAGAGKGAIQAFPGLPGDLESIGRMALNYLGYQVDENTALPTSEDIGKKLESLLGPVVPKENTLSSLIAPSEFQTERERAAKGGEMGGELLAPGGQLKLASKVAKPVIGATKKIIEAGKDLPVGMSIKGVDESLDPLGFYSAASKAVDSIAQEKGTGQQFLAQIEKTPGVKKEELLWTGLDDFLKGKKSVTKAEVQEYLDKNRVEVKEVSLGEPTHEWQGNFLVINKTAVAKIDEAEDGSYVLKDNINETVTPLKSNRLDKAVSEAEDIYGVRGMVTPYEGKPKFDKYTLPGGENYREVLLTLPTNKARADNVDDAFNMWMADAKAGKRGQYTAEELASITKDDVLDILKEDYLTPSTKGEFRSQHFDQPNVLAHMRLNDRVDADGKKVLFVEEVQSDWHQTGRKKGYESENAVKRDAELKSIQAEREKLLDEKKKLEELADPYASQGKDAPAEIVDRWSAVSNRINNLQSAQNRLNRSFPEGVPDAPFKASWHELALKRAIQLASEGGYDRIAFTTGKTQAERYDLSKQIDEIYYNKTTKSFGAYKDKKIVMLKEGVEPADLDDLIGKEPAKKLLDAPIERPTAKGAEHMEMQRIAGQDLQIGGEGMKGFYDTILPKYLDKYGKKWDAKTGMTKIRLETDAQAAEDATLLRELGVESDGKSAASVHYMDITPKMKESVLTKGQPLFQMAPAIPAGAAATQMQEENK